MQYTDEVTIMPRERSIQLDHGLVVPFPNSEYMLADEHFVVCWLPNDTGHEPRALRIYTSLYPSGGRCVSIAADNTGIMHRVV